MFKNKKMRSFHAKKEMLEKLIEISKLCYEINEMPSVWGKDFMNDEHPLNNLSEKEKDLYPFGQSFNDFAYHLNKFIIAIEEETEEMKKEIIEIINEGEN